MISISITFENCMPFEYRLDIAPTQRDYNVKSAGSV